MKKIFQTQIDFQKLLKNDILSQEFRNQMFLGVIEESAEIMKETPFKLHKKNQQFNRDNFLKECVDLQLYLINLTLSAGCTAEEFEALIAKKQQINFERQKKNY